MRKTERALREILSSIAKLADEAAELIPQLDEEENARRESDEVATQGTLEGSLQVCTPKPLPSRLLVKAAQTATRINPMNAPVIAPLAKATEGVQMSEPLRIAVFTTKYWGPTPRLLTVSFIEATPAELRRRIIAHMCAWYKTTCISFAETHGPGDIRIARGAGGYWSFVGTDILHIPKNKPTMNLEGFTMNTPESEYKRVVRHETGHTLGFPHEHMRRALVARIDPQKAYKWFLEKYGWDKVTVDAQVLTPLDETTLMGTPSDEISIMTYQLPGEIMKDGSPIIGGMDIGKTDYEFAGKIYPKPAPAPDNLKEEDWDQSEDPDVPM